MCFVYTQLHVEYIAYVYIYLGGRCFLTMLALSICKLENATASSADSGRPLKAINNLTHILNDLGYKYTLHQTSNAYICSKSTEFT